MPAEPAVVNVEDRASEGWPAQQIRQRGSVVWKTLVDRSVTASDGLSVGVAEVPAGGALHPHRHAEPEVYFVLEGSGAVTLGEEERRVREGDAVFIPGGVRHGARCGTGETLRFLYAFAVDALESVVYEFPPEPPADRRG